jgi:thioredoxin reductase
MNDPVDDRPGRDPYSIAGKFQPPETRFDVVVVGAGAAGIQAAIQAATGGASVLLVDENPVATGLMGLDAPLFYGQRATAAVTNAGRMLEQVFAANPALETAFEAGVEVALATTAWGAFVKGPSLNALPEPMVGLADETKSWMCGFGKLILATGARDLALSFKGWDQPGVMGAQALHALLTRYDAFAGRRIVVLGTGALALSTALLALEKGVEVAALVEVRDDPQGPADLVARIAAAGVPILTGRVPAEARGGVDGVERLMLAPTADPSAPPIEIACDTICQAIGVVPAVELFDVLGARLVFDAARGGHVPVLDAEGAALPNVFAVGDCAGVAVGAEGLDYGLDWMRALMAVGDPAVMVCQCEAVTRGALIGVKHPAYLGPVSNGMALRDLASLSADGPVNQDQIKRLTRAGMGPCQARRCREQVAMMLSISADVPLSDIPLASYRAPVRPLPLSVLADWEEPAEMGAGWDVWFGIPTQWVPYRDIGTAREAAHAGPLGAAATPGT